MPTTLIVPYDSCYITCSASVHASAPKINNWFTDDVIMATLDYSALSLFATTPNLLFSLRLNTTLCNCTNYGKVKKHWVGT